MKLTISQPILDALAAAADKPDWLITRIAELQQGRAPYQLALKAEEATALEELCAMNIRFDDGGAVLPQHKPLDELSLMIMNAY